MHIRQGIPTLLPDAILRCHKLQVNFDVELDELKKLTFRRMNKLQWEEQTFRKILIERHEKWRLGDRAFRLKLEREFDASIASNLKRRTIQEERCIVKELLPNQKNGDIKNRSISAIGMKHVPKPNSANSRFHQTRLSVNNGGQSAVDARRAQYTGTRASCPTFITNKARQSSFPRTSRFDRKTHRDADLSFGFHRDFRSIVFRVLSNIADTHDEVTHRKQVLEAHEHRLSSTRDDRYYNLLKQLVPQKKLRELDTIVEKNGH